MNPPSHPPGLESLLDLSEPRADWSDADLSAMLRHQLDSPSTLDARFATIRALLAHANPGVEALEALKRHAKVNRAALSQGIPPDLWRAIYFASIAAGLRAGRRISDLSDADLAAGFHWALSRPWLDADVRTLIEQVSRGAVEDASSAGGPDRAQGS